MKLTNKTIQRIDIAEDRKALRLICGDGEEIIARADGDCCSDSWIEHIELPALGFPAKVLSTEDLEFPDKAKYGSHEAGDDFDYLQFYGCKIVTDKGELIIDYRNDSNGYYGGDLVWPTEEGEYNGFYGGVFQQNVSNEDWQPVEEDLCAR